MKKNLEKLPPDIYKKMAEELYDGVYFVTKERKIIFWNKQAEAITGYTKKDVVGSCCYDNIQQHIDKNGRMLCKTSSCPLVTAMRKDKPYAKRLYLKRKDGVRVPVDVHASPIKHRGRIIGAIEVFRDASVYERLERQRERAKAVSLMDSLTSLSNRKSIITRLKLELTKYKKFKDVLHIAILDIDHFKKINDSYGHHEGDLVLRKVAHVMEHSLRVIDFIGRYGGEEFLIIFPNTPKKNCDIALKRVKKGIAESISLKGGLKVTVSIGVAKAQLDDDAESLFKRADKTLYHAKQTGRNKIVFSK